ncbi:MAG: hypothetical protein RM021_002145 [Nostoc sp. EkiNYC01]|nr:hypothetical protein [Nostoc sp. EkiNYC01]
MDSQYQSAIASPATLENSLTWYPKRTSRNFPVGCLVPFVPEYLPGIDHAVGAQHCCAPTNDVVQINENCCKTSYADYHRKWRMNRDRR